jgi:lipoate-protein ligase A
MTELLVWLDEPAEGHANMAADEVLAGEAVRQNRPLVRFYRWSQMTVSLGAFQPIATAEAEPAIASLPLVRRPSGGGAIVHGSDLTYAVAVPRDHPWGDRPQVLYDAFHQSLVDVLGSRGIVARLHPGRGLQENDEGRLLCFDRRARGDLVVSGPSPDGHKLLGSAQRRLKAAVLQHGSLLLETPRGVGAAAAHAGLFELFPEARSWPEGAIVAAWLDRLTATTGVEPRIAGGPFAAAHADKIAAAAGRFEDAAWLRRR